MGFRLSGSLLDPCKPVRAYQENMYPWVVPAENMAGSLQKDQGNIESDEQQSAWRARILATNIPE